MFSSDNNTMSDRGIPASFRHMHFLESIPLYTIIRMNVSGVPHFKTQQGIKTSNEEAKINGKTVVIHTKRPYDELKEEISSGLCMHRLHRRAGKNHYENP